MDTLLNLHEILKEGASMSDALQLDSALSSLRSSLSRAHLLIDLAEWGRFKVGNNIDLKNLLLQLKDTTYDATNLLDEFEYQKPQLKMENSDRGIVGQFISSSVTSARNLIFSSKGKIYETQKNLDNVCAMLESSLKYLGLNVEPVKSPSMPETASLSSEPKLVGRDKERDQIIKLLGVTSRVSVASASRAKRLKGESSSRVRNFSVLPIVGIGGVGKTTLAQYVYNDSRMKPHFDVKMWVCVSDYFDIKRTIKDIIECITGQKVEQDHSLEFLQKALQGKLEGRRFFLVFDDVWTDSDSEWHKLLNPLRSGREGSWILLTTRTLDVAKLVAPTTKPIELEGLPDDTFWEFFEMCAFGEKRSESYPLLHDIARGIMSKLCGSPLAAKTLGRLLSTSFTESHWREIHGNELWQLPQNQGDIVPALQLSYLYLDPPQLKRCFSFCAMFPKDYSFTRSQIVDIWVAEGFVKPEGSIRLEDTGNRYLDALASRFLFQNDPMYPGKRYVMHDLIHDMAQFISEGECFLMKDVLRNEDKMQPTVRHMSIEVNNEDLKSMPDLHRLNKLWSLSFTYSLSGIDVNRLFNQLTNIRVLILLECSLRELPNSISRLKHLRYLRLYTCPEGLPDTLWDLYNLQVIEAEHLRRIHPKVTQLINLRSLLLSTQCSLVLSRVPFLGKLTSLRELNHFTVGKEDGHRIGQLKGMNQLCGELCIKSIAYVQDKEEAAQARLVDKQYLKALILHWRNNVRQLVRSSHLDDDILESLHPPPGIERLRVEYYLGDISPSWLKPEKLPALKHLKFYTCPNLKHLSISFPLLEELILWNVGIEILSTFADGIPSSSIDDKSQDGSSSSSSCSNKCNFCTTLKVFKCNGLRNLDQFLSPQYLPSIKSIKLVDCANLVSLTVNDFEGFLYLENLKIYECRKLECPKKMILPRSLQQLYLTDCGQFAESIADCLQNLTSLTHLQLVRCKNVTSIPLASINPHKQLKWLVLDKCPELSSIGESQALASIKNVKISNCAKLIEVEQPFPRDTLSWKDYSVINNRFG